MKASRPTGSSTIRFAVEEVPPHLLSAGLGLQVVLLIIASIALTPIVVLRAAGVDIERASWAIFAALLVSGLTTMLQARPLGRFGALLTSLFEWSETEFLRRTEGSAIRRIGYERWSRNIATALGNAATEPSVVMALEKRADDPSPLVREHVRWALARHTSQSPSGP